VSEGAGARCQNGKEVKVIVAHFFVRKIKKKPYLFVETTSSNGVEQPAPAAMMLMPLSAADAPQDRQKWIRDAYYEFIKRYPDLTLLDSMDNYLRLASDHPSFDMVFRPKRRRKAKAKEEPEEHADAQEDFVDEFGLHVNSVEAEVS
jgi:hypothetical protein